MGERGRWGRVGHAQSEPREQGVLDTAVTTGALARRPSVLGSNLSSQETRAQSHGYKGGPWNPRGGDRRGQEPQICLHVTGHNLLTLSLKLLFLRTIPGRGPDT